MKDVSGVYQSNRNAICNSKFVSLLALAIRPDWLLWPTS